jgi:murein L,D-transpeptidase YcbB/YkuD
VADDGKVDFRQDVYGWDTELGAAMAGHPLHVRHQATTAAAP